MSPALAGRFFNIIPASQLMGKHQKNSQLFNVVLEILIEAYIFHIFSYFSLLQHIINSSYVFFFFKKLFYLAALGFSCSRLALCFDTGFCSCSSGA